MPLYITDRQAEEIETFENAKDREQLLSDAQRVYSYVARNQWITENDLREYGDRNGIDPDRMTQALGFLDEAGKLHRVDLDSPPAVVDAEEPQSEQAEA